MSKKISYFMAIILFFFLLFENVTTVDASQLILSPNIDNKTYESSPSGIKEILQDILSTPTKDAFTIQMSGNLDLSKAANLTNDEKTENPDQINFVSVSNPISFIGAEDTEIILPKETYFGSSLTLSNMKLKGEAIFANGHPLKFENVRQMGNVQIFGGGKQFCQGNSSLSFKNVQGENFEIIGGNQTGTFIGNSQTNIEKLTGNLKLVGGNQTGSFEGDIVNQIHFVDGRLDLFGGGEGTEATPVEVTGTINNRINSQSSEMILNQYVGGVCYGKTEGITNSITGLGQFDSVEPLIGGSLTGEIISQSDAIKNTIDTRNFSKGEKIFVGGNRYKGKIIGHITNQIQAGRVNRGSFSSISGAGGSEIIQAPLTNSPKLTPSVDRSNFQNLTEEERQYDQMSTNQRFQLAKEKTNFLVEGNVRTELLNGCVSSTNNPIRAGTNAGVIKGNTEIIVGEYTGELGGEGFVYSKERALEAENEGKTSSNFLVSAKDLIITGGNGNSGDDLTFSTSCYQLGNQSVKLNNSLVKKLLGASYSGVIEGDSLVQIYQGQTEQVSAGGMACYRHYGSSLVEMKGGSNTRDLYGGSEGNRLQKGDAQIKIYDGEFFGDIGAGSGRFRGNQLQADSDVQIFGGVFNPEARIFGGFENKGFINGNTNVTIDVPKENNFFLAPGLKIIAGRPQTMSNDQEIGNRTSSSQLILKTYRKFEDLSLFIDEHEDYSLFRTRKNKIIVDAPNGNFESINGVGQAVSIYRIELDLKINSCEQLIPAKESLNNNVHSEDASKITLRQSCSIENISNFTQLNLCEGVALSTETILNSSAATDENFKKSYANFGVLNLSAGSHLSCNKLKAQLIRIIESAKITSPSGVNKLMLKELAIDQQLFWQEKVKEALDEDEKSGRIFGEQAGVDIFTFVEQPIENSLNPANFIGFSYDGTSLTGDTSNQFGRGIRALIVDGKVQSGLGDIQLKSFDWQEELWDGSRRFVQLEKNVEDPEIVFSENFLKARIQMNQLEYETITDQSWKIPKIAYYQVFADFSQNTGELLLVEVPTQIDFGKHVLYQKEKFTPTVTGQIKIKDKRLLQTDYQLQLKVKENQIGSFFYQTEEQLYNLSEDTTILAGQGDFVTGFPETKAAVFCEIPKNKQKVGQHSTIFQWTLVENPEN
ncbi:hypothetical protein [Enterococcus sp. AZ103]|uniref:hypothetical protein n=1 Tax=Enterococcus sp. AZ103 TaxID=2774628 RepID=UPI003F2074E6